MLLNSKSPPFKLKSPSKFTVPLLLGEPVLNVPSKKLASPAMVIEKLALPVTPSINPPPSRSTIKSPPTLVDTATFKSRNLSVCPLVERKLKLPATFCKFPPSPSKVD